MNNEEKKLSWAQKRQLKARRSIVKPRAEKAKIIHRTKPSTTTLNDIPHDVMEIILTLVSLPTLLNLRLAGVGGRDSAWTARLRTLFTKRRDSLHALTFALPERQRDSEIDQQMHFVCAPSEFESRVKLELRLQLPKPDNGQDSDDAGKRIADGIREMHELRILKISVAPSNASMNNQQAWVEPQLSMILQSCTKKLCVLVLREVPLESLPSAIMDDLPNLSALSLLKCIKRFPDDMGKRMRSLSILAVSNRRQLEALPVSLLQRLEASDSKDPLSLNIGMLEPQYIDAVLDPALYPKLNASLHSLYPSL